MLAESGVLIISSLPHHFSFTDVPRLCDWEMTHCSHTLRASAGRNALDEEVAKKNGFKKLNF